MKSFRRVKPKIELKISIYGFMTLSVQAKNDFRFFFKHHKDLGVRVFLFSHPEVQVYDLNSETSDGETVNYTLVKCDDKKIIATLRKEFAKDEKLKKYLIHYQQPVSLVASDNV